MSNHTDQHNDDEYRYHSNNSPRQHVFQFPHVPSFQKSVLVLRRFVGGGRRTRQSSGAAQ
jgi:hypothetical protein